MLSVLYDLLVVKEKTLVKDQKVFRVTVGYKVKRDKIRLGFDVSEIFMGKQE